MNFENLVEHTAISFVGWLLGTVLGLGVSFVLIGLSRKINRNDKKSHPLSLFIPWRTFIVSLLLLNFFPTIPILLFGLGNTANTVSVTYTVFFLTIVIVCQTIQSQLEPILQIASWIRTLAVLSVITTIHYGIWADGGLGFVARISMTEFEAAWIFFLLFSGIALVIDEGTAIIQWFIYSHANRISTQAVKNAG